MKLKRLLCVLAVFLCVAVGIAAIGHADFGDYGGDSDYGDWGGSGDSWDSGDSGWDWDDDDDYDYNGGGVYIPYGTGGGSGGSSELTDGQLQMTGLIFLIIIILVVVLVLRSRKKAKPASKPVAPGATPTDQSTLRPVSEYLTVDPDFSAAEFQEKLSNLYVQFQNAWQAKDLEPLRPYLTDAFYAQCDRQLENNYRKTHQTNRIERIAVLGVELMGWKQQSSKDVMIAQLRTRIVDYVVSDDSGAVVRGSSTAEKFMHYEWVLERSTGVTTGGSTGTTVNYCPNCGAPIDLNHSAKCPYCDSILTTDTFDWAVTNIKGLSQRTNG